MGVRETVIAEKYSRSFVDTIADREDIWAIYDEIRRLVEVIRSTRLNRILNDSTVSAKDKEEFIQIIRQSQYRVINDLIETTLREGHPDLLLATLENCLLGISKQQNEFNVLVSVVQPLSEEQKKRITALVERRFDVKVRCIIEKIDKALLGGFVVNVNHRVIDASVRTQLKDIRSKL